MLSVTTENLATLPIDESDDTLPVQHYEYHTSDVEVFLRTIRPLYLIRLGSVLMPK